MIGQLLPSLRRLMVNVEVLATEEVITHCLDLQQPIWLASDGGAIPRRASFGWILQIGNTPIAKGNGPTYGNDPRSFRAEGYGMTSALLYLRLLQRLVEFSRYPTSVNKIICNNKGLLIRIGEASKWKYTTPNVTLRAEWDVNSLILTIYKELGMQFDFVHVKSHQDDETPVASLSLESRLNVEVDCLATKYMKEDTQRWPLVDLFPLAHAKLIIKQKLVTRKIPQTIRHAAGSIHLRQCLMERNQWTIQILDDINWEAHESSHSYHRPQQCYLIKLSYRHLPIGQTLHQRDGKYSPICPGCQLKPETQNHYIQCVAPSQIAWRLQLITALRKQMESLQTNSNLVEVILNCVNSTLAGRNINNHGPFSGAHEAQSQIGWIGLL
jgi:hypothetical protein